MRRQRESEMALWVSVRVAGLMMCRIGMVLWEGAAHAAARTPGKRHRVDCRPTGVIWRRSGDVLRRLSALFCEPRATQGEHGPTMAVCHEAEGTDPVEAIGQGVEREAADELVRLQPCDLVPAVLAVIPPAAGDVGLVAGGATAVGDGDAVGAEAGIGQDLGRPPNGFLA